MVVVLEVKPGTTDGVASGRPSIEVMNPATGRRPPVQVVPHGWALSGPRRASTSGVLSRSGS